ncbi:putative uncharacterized protein [Prevotella sp. CAG:1092]|nr:putative uncharacterized protein [Prevotella sp. CAG:1092]
MRQEVEGVAILVPFRAIEIISVLRQSGKVANAEIAAATWPIFIIRSRFAKIVYASPHELTDGVIVVVHSEEILLRQIAPRAPLSVVRSHLSVLVGLCNAPLYRELIYSARANGRGCFRTEQELLRQFADARLVFVYTIVEARHIHGLGKARVDGVVGTVDALSDRTRRVELMADILKVLSHFCAALHALLRNFVADAPHHDRRMVAMSQHKVCHVLVAPLLEESGVAIFAFRINPHVEALGHDHHTERIAKVHLHLAWHIVRGANGVGTHILHEFDLAYESSLVDSSTKRSEVVVQANALDFSRCAIKLETILLAHANRAHAKLLSGFVYHLIILI